jgi:hypothetical protein
VGLLAERDALSRARVRAAYVNDSRRLTLPPYMAPDQAL